MAKLSKIALIKVKDFEPALFGPITFNGITHKTLAEFYDISEEQKETLFYIQNKLNSLYKNEKQPIDKFLDNLLNLQNELKEIKDSKKFIISSNGSNLIVNYKCDLKILYQTENFDLILLSVEILS